MKQSIIKGMLTCILLGILFVHIVLIMQMCSYLKKLYPMNVFSIPYSGDIIWLIVVAIVSYAGMKSAHNIYKNVIPQLLPNDSNSKKSDETNDSEDGWKLPKKS